MITDYRQQEFRHITMRSLIAWLEKETGLTFTETSTYRDGEGSVHNTVPCRGNDLRMRNKPIGEAICRFINDNWVYDKNREHKMCAVLHGTGSNLHIHLQVHPNTEIIKTVIE